MSITLISMIHILPYMMYLRLLVKILLQVMDLNMAFKTQKTSKNTRNSDFRKTHEIWFSRDISRSSAPNAPFFPLRILYYTTTDYSNLNLPSPALHTVHPSTWQPSCSPNDIYEEVWRRGRGASRRHNPPARREKHRHCPARRRVE